ncbi:histidine kinase [Streptomyces sp. NPDC089919]|uniref:histidine kinase n=1 Tax=Streptomyces sp. NPDC089919 TaxID=3155188 RepID=UPI0034269EC2
MATGYGPIVGYGGGRTGTRRRPGGAGRTAGRAGAGVGAAAGDGAGTGAGSAAVGATATGAGTGSAAGGGRGGGPPALSELSLQANALQALCRQVFGFRLAMIALGTPLALGHTAPGAAAWLVGGAVLATFMGSYVCFRDWERFGPLLLRHRWLLAVDMALSTLLLVTATPDSPLGLVSVCTPLLAGLVYGWRGSAVFAALQAAIVTGVYGAEHRLADAPQTVALLPGLCLLAGAAGVSLRQLMFRFGAAGRALTETRARLAVTEAVAEERARLARDLHDSVAKTLHGLALAADRMAAEAGRADPATVREGADLVARSARRAITESRELLAGLRETGAEVGVGPDLDPGRAGSEPGRTGLDPGQADLVPAQADLVPAHAGPDAGRAGPEPGRAGPEPGASEPVGRAADPWDLASRLGAQVEEFVRETGTPATFTAVGAPLPDLPYPAVRQIRAVVAEALENARRHAAARHVAVTAEVLAADEVLGTDGVLRADGVLGADGARAEAVLRIAVRDDGRGLPGGAGLEDLRRAGRFGLVGMVERAAGIGARLHIGGPRTAPGTEIRLDLPLPVPPERRPSP